jgi:hypothetical protein
LHETARQHVAKGVAKTFVLVEETVNAPKPVLGFFTLSLCQVLAEDIAPKWAKKLPGQIPAMRLGRLAAAGGIGLFADAKDQTAADFYERFGFEPTPTEPLTLFMPMDTVRRLVDS